MPLAEARALLPHAHFEQHRPSADLAALQKLAVECQRFSPVVGVLDESSLLMDITGCAHLFGGEQALSEQIRGFVARAGFVAKLALADTIGAAWAVSRYGRSGIIPRGENEAALGNLPVAALRLPFRIIETLIELGIGTIGELRALPRASLTSRFGAVVARRLDQAFGRVPELIVPVRATEVVQAEWSFDEPATDRRSIELSLHTLIEHVVERLWSRQLGIQQLTCQMDEVSFVVGTTGPTASVPHLWELVRLHLERLALPGEVRRVAIRATMTGRRVEQQQQLVSDDRIDRRELALLLDRLRSRLGDDALVRPTLFPDAVPEFACRFESVLKERADTGANSAGLFRPVRIHSPTPVEAVSDAEGRPVGFRWLAEEHVISRCWGPEKIASGWWRGEQVRRDYYRVETATGQRFWLFQAEGSWFLQGVFE